MNEKSKKGIKFIVELLLTVIVAIITVSLIQQLLFVPVGIQGESMLPTFQDSGDTAYVQKTGYTLEHDDIIIFFRPLTQAAEDMENPAEYKLTVKSFFSNLLHLKTSISTEDGYTDDGNFRCVIKRVIGVPGDTIEIRNAVLYRNGEVVDDFPMTERTDTTPGVSDTGEIVVGEGQYYVLGDNRDNSMDSEDYCCI
jgi:signal peptidase I